MNKEGIYDCIGAKPPIYNDICESKVHLFVFSSSADCYAWEYQCLVNNSTS